MAISLAPICNPRPAPESISTGMLVRVSIRTLPDPSASSVNSSLVLKQPQSSRIAPNSMIAVEGDRGRSLTVAALGRAARRGTGRTGTIGTIGRAATVRERRHGIVDRPVKLQLVETECMNCPNQQ